MTADTLGLTGLATALAAVYLTLSVFQASARALRLAAAGPRGKDAAAAATTMLPSPQLAIAVQGTRQACLVAAALLLARFFQLLGQAAPYLWSLAVTFVVFALLLEQVGARSVALLWPHRAYALTLVPARIASAPMAWLVEPLFRLLIWKRGSRGWSRRLAVEAEDFGGLGGDEDERLRAAQGELIENVVEFSGTLVREVMTPRTEMVTAEVTASLTELVSVAVRSNRSRIPVTEGGADHVVGMVHVRDLLGLLPPPRGEAGFSSVIRPVLVVPETKPAFELLREMQAQGLQMAIVVDEYGGTAGLVTIEDLLEELVGEIADEHEVRRPDLIGQQDGSYLVRGSYPIFDLADRLGVSMPDVDADTVGGLVIALLGRLPEPGESVEVAGLHLEVAEADRRRVRRVRVRLLEPEQQRRDPGRRNGERRAPGG